MEAPEPTKDEVSSSPIREVPGFTVGGTKAGWLVVISDDEPVWARSWRAVTGVTCETVLPSLAVAIF